MKYVQSNINYAVEPQEFNKDSSKEVLQYAVGGLLYMPASTSVAHKIISGEYDFVKSMVLDLEDSLGDDMVGHGQRSITATIEELANAIKSKDVDFNYSDLPLIFVRVRSFGQIQQTYDMLGENIKYITGFNIPKFSKSNCDEYIEEFMGVLEKVHNDFDNKYELYIMPIIEDKETLYRQLRMENLLYVNGALREIADNVLNIRVGGADFCSVFGIRRGMGETIHEIGAVKSVLNDIMNVFGKSYVVSGPVWEYFQNKDRKEDTRWKDGLIRELAKDKLNGFIGKTSIHPTQLPIIQSSLVVDSLDYEDAMSILGTNVNTTGVKKSVGGNRMNEMKTHSNWARKIIGLARVYGVAKETNTEA